MHRCPLIRYVAQAMKRATEVRAKLVGRWFLLGSLGSLAGLRLRVFSKGVELFKRGVDWCCFFRNHSSEKKIASCHGCHPD